MDCSSCNCLCRNGNVRRIIFRCLRFCSLATKSPIYISSNHRMKYLRRKIMHCTFQRVFFCFSWFFSSGRIVSKQPFSESIRTSNCTFSSYLALAVQDFLKTAQLFPCPPLFYTFFLWQIKNCYRNIERYRVRTLLKQNE